MGLSCPSDYAVSIGRYRVAESYVEGLYWSCGDFCMEGVHEAYFVKSATSHISNCGESRIEFTKKILQTGLVSLKRDRYSYPSSASLNSVAYTANSHLPGNTKRCPRTLKMTMLSHTFLRFLPF